MKTKLAIAFALLASLASAQTPTLTVGMTNMNSTAPIRQFLPVPPNFVAVEVFIYDTVISDVGYNVTLTYTTTDGVQHVTTQYFSAGTNYGSNLVTLATFYVDAVSASAQVLAQAYTGAQAQGSTK